jgi:hypothetical protein
VDYSDRDAESTEVNNFPAKRATCLGFLFPDRVIGLHLNYIPGSFQPPHESAGQDLAEEERAFLATRAVWVETEGAYSRIHATRPQSLAYALNDSPVGLASWIIENFRAWSDCEGDAVYFDARLGHICLSKGRSDAKVLWVTAPIGSITR